ncbi:hypothetical protein EPO34_00085 [Patescibacteria group bacterium]|nr:MAG: hypothetical protein EPO34_00085 [Patescibacteria group bacterium]
MRRLLFFLVTAGILIGQPVFAAVPNDPLIEQQWYLGKIKAFDAWDTATGSANVVVAVLDTGLDLDHPDVAGNLWTNPGEIPGDGLDNDQNGHVDDLHGWDFVDDDALPDPSPAPGDEAEATIHGTAIAGVIGAIGNNGTGVSGVNWQVRLMPLRILDREGSGNSADATAAIRYAMRSGASVINLSFTGAEVDGVFRQTIKDAYDAGVVVVAAVGNKTLGGTDLNQAPLYPVCFEQTDGGDSVLGVAATTPQDTKAGFSNYGSSCTDIAAPGIDIFNVSYQAVGTDGFAEPYRGGWNGTSIAAPIISGAVALLKGAFPNLGPADLKTVLQLSVDPVDTGALPRGALGAGRVNLARALEVGKAVSAAKAPGTAAPIPSVPPVPVPANVIALRATRVVVAAGRGFAPRVSVYDGEGKRLASFLAYAEGFLGGVQAAVGDLDLDGTDEIVTVPGAGGGPHVRVFTLDGTLRGQFFAFDAADRHGLELSVADTDRDGRVEIVTRALTGGPSGIRAFRLDGTRLVDPASFVVPASPLTTPFGAFGRADSTLASLLADPSGTRLRLTDRAGTDLGGFALLAQDRPARSMAVSSR